MSIYLYHVLHTQVDFISPYYPLKSKLPDPWSLLLLFWLKLLNSDGMSSPRTLLQFSMRKRTSSHTCRVETPRGYSLNSLTFLRFAADVDNSHFIQLDERVILQENVCSTYSVETFRSKSSAAIQQVFKFPSVDVGTTRWINSQIC